MEIGQITKHKNLCPHGDDLLAVGDSVKMVLILMDKNRIGEKKKLGR